MEKFKKTKPAVRVLQVLMVVAVALFFGYSVGILGSLSVDIDQWSSVLFQQACILSAVITLIGLYFIYDDYNVEKQNQEFTKPHRTR